MKDEQLYLRIQGGDTAAFDALYVRYERPLYAFLVSYVGRELGEEIFQEVFLRLLKDRSLDFSNGSLKAWLYCVARNLALNSIAQNKNQKKLPAETDPKDLSSDEHLIFEERNLALGEAVTKLPPALATVYQLRKFGLSYQEIADQLNVPLGTIKSRMNQIILRLRESLLSWREA